MNRIFGGAREDVRSHLVAEAPSQLESMKSRQQLLKHACVLQTTWPGVAIAYEWVHQAAKILDNESGLDARGVRRRFQGLIGIMSRWKAKAGKLQPGIAHFLKVTKSYWSGIISLLRCRGLASN